MIKGQMGKQLRQGGKQAAWKSRQGGRKVWKGAKLPSPWMVNDTGSCLKNRPRNAVQQACSWRAAEACLAWPGRGTMLA